MIGFFRKIRRKLADDNKPMKYMRYAVGEILLVMVGILLALQVNNWNEERKTANVEIQVLKGIQIDLKVDLDWIDKVIMTFKRKLTYFKMVDPNFPFPKENMIELEDSSSIINYNLLMNRPKLYVVKQF
jgi:hypothetical protein